MSISNLASWAEDYIYRNRDEFFKPDMELKEDVPNREKQIVLLKFIAKLIETDRLTSGQMPDYLVINKELSKLINKWGRVNLANYLSSTCNIR